jgi:IS30 family transposase
MRIELFSKKVQERLSLPRIQSIFLMKKHGKTHREIARGCDCSASTVSDTLNLYRHPSKAIWELMNSYERARYVFERQKSNIKSRECRQGVLEDPQKQDYVHDKLINEEWSPEMIANEMPKSLKGKKVCRGTIYNYIKENKPELKEYLYMRGKPRKQRVTHRRSRFKAKQRETKKRIDQRPEAVNNRKEFGHWEVDLVIGAKQGSKYVIMSLVERKTRYKHFVRMPNREAQTTLSYLRAFIINQQEGAVKSLTFDNGGEFSEFFMHRLEKLYGGLRVYYTDTYAPQQKGSNEHANGRLRRKYPKGTDFINVEQKELNIETKKLNNKPMKIIGKRKPVVAFEEELGLLQQKRIEAA